ncbi:hypothetical protein Q0Z83_022220 [Actinoplanes sichuanensis]|nr:hypothetical protein Q0Z83_022220 [Actinoplanes sichuanensis]
MVRRLLEAQRVTAEQSAYEPWSIGQPLIGDTYVELQTEKTVSERSSGEPTYFDAHEMLTEFTDVVMVGGPGTGKSTLAKNIVRESAEFWLNAGWFRRTAAPVSSTVAVRVPAAGLAEAHGETLAEALADHFTERGVSIGADVFRRRPARGAEWLIIIDGVDEILSSTERSRLLTLIRLEVTSRSRTMRLVITSRSPLDAGVPATELRLCVFDDGRLELFAEKWFAYRRNPDPRGEARRFLTRFGTGPLANLIRVPLMAAMAAVIHEFDRAARLPTSRTELYEQFVELLRRSRGQLPSLAVQEAEVWLADNIDHLLMVAATATVQSGPGALFRSVTDYCTAEAPTSVRSWLNSAEGREALRESLTATSLVVSDGTAIAFIHHSVAEFLAAPAQPVDLSRRLSELDDPNTRSFALFCIARAGLAETAIHSLLGGPVSDQMRAGHLLLDGATVDPDAQGRVVTALGTCLLSDGAAAGEALMLLAGLAVIDDAVCRWLTTMAESPQTPPWPRTLISDKIADIDAALGEQLLVAVASDRRIGTPCRRWAARRLTSRGNRMGGHLLKGVDNWVGSTAPVDEAGTSLTVVADQQIAMDQRHTLDVRAEATLRLVDDHFDVDPRLQDVLERICRDGGAPVDIRCKAAAAVARRRGTDGIRVIQDLLREPSTPPDTVAVMVETLATRTDGAAADLLHATATDRTVPLATRTSILASARHNYNCRLPSDLALDPTAEPDLRTEAIRFFRNHGGGHGVMHALCVDRSAPRPTRALVIDTMRHGSCRDDPRLLLQVATDPDEDGMLRLDAARALLDRNDPAAHRILLDLASDQRAEWWPLPGAAAVRRYLHPRISSPAEEPSRSTPDPVEQPDLPDELPADPEQLCRLVSRAAVALGHRKAAATRLLAVADSPTMDWLISFAWTRNGDDTRGPDDLGWLRNLVVDHLVGPSGSLDRCRAMVLDARYDPGTRGRLIIHLVRNGNQSDLSRVRRLALAPEIDVRAREILLDRLLQRHDPEDVVVLIDTALQPHDSRLAGPVVRKLLAVGEHQAVRRLWPSMWDDRIGYETRLVIGETLAYAGSPADHDEVRRLISAAVIPPAIRLRLAEILSHRGDRLAREALRGLACDDELDGQTRAKALALIAVPREPADLLAIRRVALGYNAPGELRESAMRSLGSIGTAGALGVIKAIGQDPSNSIELRRSAGETLAQLGDQTGLVILDQLASPDSHSGRPFRHLPEIARR